MQFAPVYNVDVTRAYRWSKTKMHPKRSKDYYTRPGKRGGLFKPPPPLSIYIPLPLHDDVKLTNLSLFYFILRELLFRIFNFESEGKVLVNFMDVQKIFP